MSVRFTGTTFIRAHQAPAYFQRTSAALKRSHGRGRNGCQLGLYLFRAKVGRF